MRIKKEAQNVSVEDHREITKDYTTSDVLILKRIQFIKTLCQNIIRQELDKYRLK